MKIDCVYKDENGTEIKIDDYVVYNDKDDPEKLYLYKIVFGERDGCVICKNLRKINGNIEVIDYDALTDVVNLYMDMSEDGKISGFIRLDASSDEEAYAIYENMVYAAARKPLEMSRLRKEDPQLYYTIKAMQAGGIDWLEVKDRNELIEWSYEITADDNVYYVKETTIDGKEKKVENYVVKI